MTCPTAATTHGTATALARRRRPMVRPASDRRRGDALPAFLEEVGRQRRVVGQCRVVQPRLRRTMATTDSIRGTSISTPTTIASATPDWRPNSAMAVATGQLEENASASEGGELRHTPSYAHAVVEHVSQADDEMNSDQKRHRQQQDHKELCDNSLALQARTAASATLGLEPRASAPGPPARSAATHDARAAPR